MSYKKEDLVIETGITFEKGWYYKDSDKVAISLDDYQARMQIRERIDSTATILSLTSSPAAGITLQAGAQTGRIDIRISALDTESLDFDRAVYDLEIYKPLDDTEVLRLVNGTIILKSGITR